MGAANSSEVPVQASRKLRRPAEGDAAERLVPEVQCGLYDDWEEDFGVPWVFPLSIFLRSPS